MSQKFEFLLNAMEHAASRERPCDFDYSGKHKAVLDYVSNLESDLLADSRDFALIAKELDCASTRESVLRKIRDDKAEVASLVEKVRKLLEWLPTCSVGSSGHMRRMAVEGAIDRVSMTAREPVA